MCNCTIRVTSLVKIIRQWVTYLYTVYKIQQRPTLHRYRQLLVSTMSLGWNMQTAQSVTSLAKIISQLPTFIPCSVSSKGLQYTGTGTGTELLAGVAVGIWGWNFAGRLQPYACILPSSFFTWARTCLYCSLRSFSLSFFAFSDVLSTRNRNYC